MNYLSVGIFSEGTTDDRTLPDIVRRLLDDLIAQDQVIPLESYISPIEAPRLGSSVDQYAAFLDTHAQDWSLVLLHRDADHRNTSQIRARLFEPLEARSGGERWVPIIPVRNLEAWLLCDRGAIARAVGVEEFGVSWPEELTGGGSVEGLPNTKGLLDGCIRACLGGRRGRRGSGAGAYMSQIAEEIALPVLRGLSSFREFEEDFGQGLRRLGWPFKG